MERYILTTFKDRRPVSKSYIDASAAVKDWLEVGGRTNYSVEAWVSSLKHTKCLTYIENEREIWDDGALAVITTVEIF